jgi:hypothetical protein
VVCKVFRGSNGGRGGTGEQVFLVVVRDGAPDVDWFLPLLLVRERFKERIQPLSLGNIRSGGWWRGGRCEIIAESIRVREEKGFRVVAWTPFRMVADGLGGRVFWGVHNARVLGKGGGSRAWRLGPNYRVFEENPTVERGSVP